MFVQSSAGSSSLFVFMPQSKKGPKIRQGSPEEEAALVSHIASLAQTAKQCTEAGQLAELLVLLGHEADARRIQSLLSAVIAQQQAAAQRAQPVPAAATDSLNNGPQECCPACKASGG